MGNNKKKDKKNKFNKKKLQIKQKRYLNMIKTFSDLPTLVSEDVQKEDDLNFVEDMKKILHYAKNGVGLAAIQIGISKRIFVTDFQNNSNLKVFINPVLLKTSDNKIVDQEGCLSFPGVFTDVERFDKIWVRYLDEDFNEKEDCLKDFNARVWLHEFDHLDDICHVRGKYLDSLANEV